MRRFKGSNSEEAVSSFRLHPSKTESPQPCGCGDETRFVVPPCCVLVPNCGTRTMIALLRRVLRRRLRLGSVHRRGSEASSGAVSTASHQPAALSGTTDFPTTPLQRLCGSSKNRLQCRTPAGRCLLGHLLKHAGTKSRSLASRAASWIWNSMTSAGTGLW